jgi:hypothetical protein
MTATGEDARRALIDADRAEAARLIRLVGGPHVKGETTKSRMRRTAAILGWSAERVRHVWHKDAGRIDAYEMDQLRLLSAIGRFSTDVSGNTSGNADSR